MLLEVTEPTGLPANARFVASTLRATLRAADTACRLEGDRRYGLILEDTPEAGAVWTVERFRRALTARATQPHVVSAGVACYPAHAFTADDLRRAVAESGAHVLVAEVEGRVIGSIIGTFDGWRGNIYRLAVHPHYRRQGVARALVVEVEKKLARQGVKRITALVERDHPWATGFWEAVGYGQDRRIVRHVRSL